MPSISLGDPAIAAISSLLGTDLVAISRGGVEVARITVANLWTDVPLTGTPTAPTPPKANSSTRVATTAYVKNNLADYGALAVTNTWITGQKFGNGAGASDVVIAGAAGAVRSLTFNSGANPRARLALNTAAEGGSDSGSELCIFTFNDAGFEIIAMLIPRTLADPIFIGRDLETSDDITCGGFLFVSDTISVAGDQVVAGRQTGWSAPTGTKTRTAFDGSGATLAETREALAALIEDVMTHGLIGT